jgi:hypothetical protein
LKSFVYVTIVNLGKIDAGRDAFMLLRDVAMGKPRLDGRWVRSREDQTEWELVRQDGFAITFQRYLGAIYARRDAIAS